ncbi:EPIDERMAL PATTERNING FACTOR-like protein 2 [Sesamum indicum]|uniref:Epidermal patterning factor-like protein n=1 Tax=Sesamum indicum TaxID=4182 RepID=A0A8M8V6H5_SESIN|nr:EPIDERMAL PATTERNING FACTOR-like protein 2 [Sesamum indicum]
MVCCHRLAVSILVIVISTSSQFRLFGIAEGRKMAQTAGNFQTVEEDKKTMWRAQIGSRPPQCERRCSSCAHCEAIQVPTNPQTRSAIENSASGSSAADARGDDHSNYKPMSWKSRIGDQSYAALISGVLRYCSRDSDAYNAVTHIKGEIRIE